MGTAYSSWGLQGLHISSKRTQLAAQGESGRWPGGMYVGLPRSATELRLWRVSELEHLQPAAVSPAPPVASTQPPRFRRWS